MLACDYDGTIATAGKITPEAERALLAAKAAGMRLALVTGRFFDELREICPQLAMFDLVVAENGAIAYLPDNGALLTIGGPPSSTLFEALIRHNVPFSQGRIMTASFRRYEARMRAAVEEATPERELIPNKNDLMLLPAGVDKASGMRLGLERLGIMPEQVIGVGDGENDLPLVRAAGLGVALANAVEPLKAVANLVMEEPNGAGVARLVSGHLGIRV